MSDAFKTRTMKRKNVKGLALSAPAPKPTPSAQDAQLPGAHGSHERGDTLEIGVEFRLDLRSEDLVPIKELGSGNGGTVSKVMHTATKVVMARKIIHVEAKREVRKRIVRELQIMFECNSPYIVSFYGAFMNEGGDVIMCMEYMDTGSLDFISRTFGPVRVDVLGKIAEAILGGLTYLYRAHKIMHRDIKPSNVLVNSRGQIKLCDFGVSSELDNSVADTFVGTGTYMAPERIQGSPYTVKSDVWSVGLTLMELAIGRFPFAASSTDDDDEEEAGGPQGILDLLQQIVLEPAPKLPKSDAFPQILEDVIAKCMMKAPEERPTPQELYETDPFLQAAKRTPVDLEQWAVGMMEKQKRKSHLAPQLSPATRSLLRGEDGAGSNAPTPSLTSGSSARTETPSSSYDRTPTTGEIPIATHHLMGNGSSNSAASTPAPYDRHAAPRAEPQPQPQSQPQTSRSAFPPRTTSHQHPPQQQQQRERDPHPSSQSQYASPSSRYEQQHQQHQPQYAERTPQQMNLPIRPAPPASHYSSDSTSSLSGVPRPSRRVERERERERGGGGGLGSGSGGGERYGDRMVERERGVGARTPELNGSNGLGSGSARDAFGRRAPRPGGVGMGLGFAGPERGAEGYR